MAIYLQHYWSGEFLAANAFIGLNLVGALLLGMLVGYERSYNGRAAGMRLYGLVCMASTALTVFIGHPALWYGGTAELRGPGRGSAGAGVSRAAGQPAHHVRRSRAHVAVLRGERGPGPRRVAGPAGAGDGRFRGRHQLQHRAGAQLTGAAGSPQPRLADAFAARRIPQQVRSTPMTITLPFRRTPSPRLACLRDVSLFAGLTQPELAIVDSLLHEREYLAHEVIFDEGEVGQAIFFVLDGVVAICLQGSPDDGHLASLGPGEFFGELGLLEDSARSAQAWAAADCRLLALFREDFNDLMDSHLRIGHKIGRQLLRHLGRRLREAGSPGAHRSR
jgi:CRP-like cAMP-binding protein